MDASFEPEIYQMDFSDCDDAIEFYPNCTFDAMGPMLPPLQIKTPMKEAVPGVTKDTPSHFVEFTNHNKYYNDLRKLYQGGETVSPPAELSEPFKPGYPFNYSLCSPVRSSLKSYTQTSDWSDAAVIDMEALHPLEDSADDVNSFNAEHFLPESPKTDYFSDFGPCMPKEISEISILSGLCSSGSDQDRMVYEDAMKQALKTTKLRLEAGCYQDVSETSTEVENGSMLSIDSGNSDSGKSDISKQSATPANNILPSSVPIVAEDTPAASQLLPNDIPITNTEAKPVEQPREASNKNYTNYTQKRNKTQSTLIIKDSKPSTAELETEYHPYRKSTSTKKPLKPRLKRPAVKSNSAQTSQTSQKTRKRGPGRKRAGRKKSSMIVTLVYDRSKAPDKRRRKQK